MEGYGAEPRGSVRARSGRRPRPPWRQHRPQQRHPQPSPPRQISEAGTVTLRIAGRLRHIGVGRTYAGTYVLLLAQDLHVRVVNAATGELLRELVIDPRRDYQPIAAPNSPTKN
jgi:hypothetical protein